MHVEDVVAGDGPRAARAVAARREDEGEGRAPAGRTFDLDERQVVAAGEQVDGSIGDGSLADGAGRAIRGRSSMVQRIHSWGVYRLTAAPAVGRVPLRGIPPGGIIRAT